MSSVFENMNDFINLWCAVIVNEFLYQFSELAND